MELLLLLLMVFGTVITLAYMVTEIMNIEGEEVLLLVISLVVMWICYIKWLC